MRTSLPTIIVLVLLFAPAGATEDRRGASTAIRDLSSPYREVRRRAVELLSRGGAETEDRLRQAYPDADYRTKELILLCFRGGRPEKALDLVLDDIASPDGGVRGAQRRLVGAAFGRSRDLTQRILRAMGPLRDYAYEEALRCLPGPGRRTRAALTRLVRESDPSMRGRIFTLADRVADLDRFRAGLDRLAKDRDGSRSAPAAALRTFLLRHDTERALLAVIEAGGDQGSYEGLFDILRDLSREEDALDRLLGRLYRERVDDEWLLGELRKERALGARLALLSAASPDGEWITGVLARLVGREPPDARDVLQAIVKWRPMPGETGSSYEFVEPLEPGLDETELRQYAAMALGDVGSWPDLLALTAYYGSGDVPFDLRTFGGEYLQRNIAYACASLGDERPLRRLVAEWEDRRMISDKESILAAAYSRLNEHEKAYAAYRRATMRGWRDPLDYYNYACALSRGGEPARALDQLKRAVANGYGKDPRALDWLDRDRDLENLRKTPEFRVFRIALASRYRR